MEESVPKKSSSTRKHLLPLSGRSVPGWEILGRKTWGEANEHTRGRGPKKSVREKRTPERNKCPPQKSLLRKRVCFGKERAICRKTLTKKCIKILDEDRGNPVQQRQLKRKEGLAKNPCLPRIVITARRTKSSPRKAPKTARRKRVKG